MSDRLKKSRTAVDLTDDTAANSQLEVARLRKRHRDLYESGRDGYIRIDLEWRVLEFNSALLKLLGYQREELLNCSLRSYVPEQWHDVLGRVYREQVLAKGYSDLFEVELLRADGTHVTVEVQAHLSRDEDDHPESVWAFVREIPDQAGRDSLPGERGYHFQVLSDTAFDWVYWVDPEGRIVHNSHSCLRLTGYPSEEFINDPSRLIAIVHPDDRSKFERHLNDEVDHPGLDSTQFRIVRADGEILWIEHRCTTMFDRDGRLLGRRACNANITLRKEMESALNESLERFRTLAEQSLMGIAIYNEHGMTFMNQALADIIGFPVEQIRTWSFENIAAMIHSEDFGWIVERFHRRLQGDETVPNRYQMRLRTGSGTIKWVDLYARMVTLDGRPHVVTNMVDITELAAAKSSLEAANTALQEQQALLEEKNNVLRGVLNQIETEKQSLALRIQTNLERVVMPHLRTLRSTSAPLEQSIIDQVETSIRDITSEFVERLSTLGANLAPRELQVCKLVRDGLSTKEIAGACNVSVRTVEVWRKRIRRKLGLANRGVNLFSYLRSLEP